MANNNFNLEEELDKVRPLIGDIECDSMRENARLLIMMSEKCGQTGKKEFLYQFICRSYKNPQLHTYLEDFLQSFDIVDLNKNAFAYTHDLPFLQFIISGLELVSLECFRLLFEAGLDVNLLDVDGNMPLIVLEQYSMIISEEGNLELTKEELHNHIREIIKLFVKYGADLNHANYEGITILQYFSGRNLTDLDKIIINSLLENGASYTPTVNSKDEFNDFINYMGTKPYESKILKFLKSMFSKTII